MTKVDVQKVMAVVRDRHTRARSELQAAYSDVPWVSREVRQLHTAAQEALAAFLVALDDHEESILRDHFPEDD